ncbi:hypothetical protein BVU17_09115 [Haloarcula taiwanensis]|uniref:Uncharacterized protein n=1 Tax=Haloarcula taiwanensis TaxID=1932004 RepID=A0A2H4ZYV7_9EURY|nr:MULTISPECIES: DUF6517 family protein [Haloarcula]AUG47666.1 hypothetical protein BVU17_09115 [Haloarcula taiwanensis]RLM32695.1 hypothetical protein DVK01_20015 [Haloarcula sp. Atlit-120R]
MVRRLLPVAVALLLVTSGCVGLITGETVTFEASPATVSDSTLDSTGYELNNATQANVTRDVTVAGQDRTVRLVTERRQYTRSGSLLGVEVVELSRFVVVSVPSATVAGQTLNPAADWANRRVLEAVQGQTGSIDDVESAGNRTVRALGADRQVSEYTGTTEVAGQSIDVRLHLVSFQHEGDIVIGVAVHPETVDETDAVDDLLSGLQHGGD